jgi:hypothetical protein
MNIEPPKSLDPLANIIDRLTTVKMQRDKMRDTLKKCFAHLGKEIQRKSLNESSADGTQALALEVANILDDSAAQNDHS